MWTQAAPHPNVKLRELGGASLWVRTGVFSEASPLQFPAVSEQNMDEALIGKLAQGPENRGVPRGWAGPCSQTGTLEGFLD